MPRRLEESPSELALAVATGDADWRRLKDLGFSLRKVRGGWRGTHSPPTPVVVPVTATLLAAGLVRYSARPRELQPWAVSMLGADCFDFAPLEDHIAGTLLLDALWDIAQTGVISPTALDAATRLGERTP